MIAIDTSALVAYLSGAMGPDVELVQQTLEQRQAVLPAVVLTELLSDPKLPESDAKLLKEMPLLSLSEGFWERAGNLRARVLARKHKARVADALIAQSCLDHNVPLITRDRDFRHFARVSQITILP